MGVLFFVCLFSPEGVFSFVSFSPHSATDTNNVKRVFESVKDFMVSRILNEVGFI